MWGFVGFASKPTKEAHDTNDNNMEAAAAESGEIDDHESEYDEDDDEEDDEDEEEDDGDDDDDNSEDDPETDMEQNSDDSSGAIPKAEVDILENVEKADEDNVEPEAEQERRKRKSPATKRREDVVNFANLFVAKPKDFVSGTGNGLGMIIGGAAAGVGAMFALPVVGAKQGGVGGGVAGTAAVMWS